MKSLEVRATAGSWDVSGERNKGERVEQGEGEECGPDVSAGGRGVQAEGLSGRVYVCVGGSGGLGRAETVVCVKQMNKSVVSNSI